MSLLTAISNICRRASTEELCDHYEANVFGYTLPDKGTLKALYEVDGKMSAATKEAFGKVVGMRLDEENQR